MTSSIGTNAGTGNGELYTNAVNTAAKWGDTVGAGSTVGFDVPVNFSVATSKFTVNASTGAAVFAGAVTAPNAYLSGTNGIFGYGDLSAAVIPRNASDGGPNLVQIFAAGAKRGEFSSTGLAVTGSITQSSLAGGGRRALYCDNNGVIGV